MTKFRDYLNDHIVSHWRDKYIDYEYLKHLIDNEYINAPPSLNNSTYIDMSQSVTAAEQYSINDNNSVYTYGGGRDNTMSDYTNTNTTDIDIKLQESSPIISHINDNINNSNNNNNNNLQKQMHKQHIRAGSNNSPNLNKSSDPNNIENHMKSYFEHRSNNNNNNNTLQINNNNKKNIQNSGRVGGDEDTTIGSPFSSPSVSSPKVKEKSELNSPLLMSDDEDDEDEDGEDGHHDEDEDDEEIEMDQLALDNNGAILNITAATGNRVKVRKGINNGVNQFIRIAKTIPQNINQLNSQINNQFMKIGGIVTGNTNNNINNNVNTPTTINDSTYGGDGDEVTNTNSIISTQIEIVASSKEHQKLMSSGHMFSTQESFQEAFVDQVNKVDSFFVERYRKTKIKCVELCNMIPFLSTNEQLRTIRNIEFVKQGFHDNYHYLESLEAFKDLNIKGFSKALEKYEKKNHIISTECRKYLDNTRLSLTDSPVKDLSRRIKHIYARYFTGNDIKLASNQIKTNVENERFEKYNLFTIGLLIGICIVLGIQVIFNYYYYYPHESPPVDSPLAWLLFRISLLPILLGSMFSVMTRLWEKAGINYVFIFEFKPDHKRSSSRYLKYGLIFVALWLLALNVYIDSTSHTSRTSRYLILIPIIFVLSTLLIGIQPFPIMAHRTRFWVMKKIVKVVSAPFVPVRFPDFFMSVQLLSLGEFLFNIQSMVCIFNYNTLDMEEAKFCAQSRLIAFPILNALPYFWRVMQCFRRYWETRDFFPHITSAIRSIFSIVALILSYIALEYGQVEWSYIKISWFIVNVVGSFYKIYADICVDFGLFLNYKTNAYWPLREKMVFKRRWIYYCAMIGDGFLRFTWLIIFSIRKGSKHRLDNPLFLLFFSLTEVVWATNFIFFRVESEHVNNADTYSTFRDIPIPFSQEYHSYMDEKKKRKRRKKRNNNSNSNQNQNNNNGGTIVSNGDDDDNNGNGGSTIHHRNNTHLGSSSNGIVNNGDQDGVEMTEMNKDLNFETGTSDFKDDVAYNLKQSSLRSSMQRIASHQELTSSMNRISSHQDLNSSMQRIASHHELNSSMSRIATRIELNSNLNASR